MLYLTIPYVLTMALLATAFSDRVARWWNICAWYLSCWNIVKIHSFIHSIIRFVAALSMLGAVDV